MMTMHGASRCCRRSVPAALLALAMAGGGWAQQAHSTLSTGAGKARSAGSGQAKLQRSVPFIRPDWIAVHPKTGTLYVLRHDPGKSHELVMLDKDGKPSSAFPLKTLGNDPWRPASFCLDASDKEPVEIK